MIQILRTKLWTLGGVLATAMFLFAFLSNQRDGSEDNTAFMEDASGKWQFRMHKRGQAPDEPDVEGILDLRHNNTHVMGTVRLRDPKTGMLADKAEELTVGWLHGNRIQFNMPVASTEPIEWSHYSGTLLTGHCESPWMKGQVTLVKRRQNAAGSMEMHQSVIGDWGAEKLAPQ